MRQRISLLGAPTPRRVITRPSLLTSITGVGPRGIVDLNDTGPHVEMAALVHLGSILVSETAADGNVFPSGVYYSSLPPPLDLERVNSNP
jgi:hypothetical protein